MNFSKLNIEDRGVVRIIQINNPATLNSLIAGLLEELMRAFVNSRSYEVYASPQKK